MSTKPFITIDNTRVRRDTIRKYECKRSPQRPMSPGVIVYLDDGKQIVDWEMTVEQLDKLMETE